MRSSGMVHRASLLLAFVGIAIPIASGAALPNLSATPPPVPSSRLAVPSGAPRIDASAPTAALEPGVPAPPFKLQALNGNEIGLGQYKGQTFVLLLFKTTCVSCRAQIAELSAAAPKLMKDGIAVLGIDTGDGVDVVRAYAALHGIAFPLAMSDDAFAAAYDASEQPALLLIDGRGLLRARLLETVGAELVTKLAETAKEGRNVVLASPLQAKIDALLRDRTIVFGHPATDEANAKKAESAIANAEKLLAQSDASRGNVADVTQTRAREAELRDKAIAALVNVGTSVHDQTLLTRLQGDAAQARGQWREAEQAYRDVLDLAPNDADAQRGLALASQRLASDNRLPSPGDLTKAVALAKQRVDANPNDPNALAMLANADLAAGRAEATSGDVARARDDFADAGVWSERLRDGDPSRAPLLEEAQEGIVALGLGAKSGLSVSLAPWTGPPLPGSVPDTLRYRLAVVGKAAKEVDLKAADVPKGWIATFCTERVCTPGRVRISLPASRVGIIELQLVPPGSRTVVPKVRIIANDGAGSVTATT